MSRTLCRGQRHSIQDSWRWNQPLSRDIFAMSVGWVLLLKVGRLETWLHDAFSPQLTERTERKAVGPRNDDTFHEGCSSECIRERILSMCPVDGSSFTGRMTTAINRSISRTTLTMPPVSGSVPVRVGRVVIAIYCLSWVASRWLFCIRNLLDDLF